MLFTLFVGVDWESQSRECRYTAIGIGKVMTAQSFLSLGVDLAFLFMQGEAVFSDVTSFHYLVFLLTEKSRGYGG